MIAPGFAWSDVYGNGKLRVFIQRLQVPGHCWFYDSPAAYMVWTAYTPWEQDPRPLHRPMCATCAAGWLAWADGPIRFAPDAPAVLRHLTSAAQDVRANESKITPLNAA